MALTIKSSYRKTITVAAPVEDCYNLLMDFERSVSHMPGVASFTKVEKDVYRWDIKAFGTSKAPIHPVYVTKFSGKKNKEVSWVSLEGEGNTRVKGRWDLNKNGPKETEMAFSTDIETDLPLPKLLKAIVQPIIDKQLRSTIDGYAKNLTKTLEAEAG